MDLQLIFFQFYKKAFVVIPRIFRHMLKHLVNLLCKRNRLECIGPKLLNISWQLLGTRTWFLKSGLAGLLSEIPYQRASLNSNYFSTYIEQRCIFTVQLESFGMHRTNFVQYILTTTWNYDLLFGMDLHIISLQFHFKKQFLVPRSCRHILNNVLHLLYNHNLSEFINIHSE